MLVMVALNRESLFNRNVCAFGPTTMRSTMCYCMAALCKPCFGKNPMLSVFIYAYYLVTGDIILDPMCGGGSIPLETAMAFSGCIAVGADVNTKALERCVVNLVSSGCFLDTKNTDGLSYAWIQWKIFFVLDVRT
ncbi:unnamed protein product [Nippostrongylus brasiliensis]|uniref:UPF0020 domain-containing protein n=1 Tax=Nippostrongylus brasiliensis TaxID=27835 RepID=A0A0N4XS09_NIPBR|nr:unnamed protein product [Nippostrongylus brasiliensis]